MSVNSQELFSSNCIEPKLILDIDGLNYSFTTGEIDKDYKAYISIKGQTTKAINQQLELESGGSSSISTAKVELIDKDEFLTELFSYGFQQEEFIGRRARFYVGEGLNHPCDSIKIIDGIIDSIIFGAGNCVLNIAHPEKLRRQELFEEFQTELSASISNTSTALSLVDASGFIVPNSEMETLARIDDEFISYTGITGNTLTGVARGFRGTIPGPHDQGAEISTAYRITGNPIDIALKLMLSGSGFQEYSSLIKDINSNEIKIDPCFARKELSMVPGDLIEITEDDLVVGSGAIVAITEQDEFDIIELDFSPTVVSISNAKLRHKSKYDVYPIGGEIPPRHIDIQRHESVRDTYANSLISFDAVIEESITITDFINNEIYAPSRLYNIPREGKISVGFLNPALGIESAGVIGLGEIVDPSKVVLSRSINKHFYNSAVFKYEKDLIKDKFLKGQVVVDEDSNNRIKVGQRAFKIEAGSVVSSSDNDSLIETNLSVLLDRYRFAAEEIRCSILFGKGIGIEIGDVVKFGDDLIATDTVNADRRFKPRFMQVINKSVNLISGAIKIILLDTNYLTAARYGVIAPSSEVLENNGSTLKLGPLYENDNETQFNIWCQFENEKVIIHNEDWTVCETVEISAVLTDGSIVINPSLVSNETGLIVEPANYEDLKEDSLFKDFYTFLNPQLEITNVISTKEIEVSDTESVSIGSVLEVRTFDASNISKEVRVTSISSNILTLSDDLSYLPSVGDLVDLIGFKDGGQPYRII